MPLAAIKSHPYYEQLMETLRTHVKADRMYPRQMANTLWAFAKIDFDKDDIIDALLEQTERVRHTSHASTSRPQHAGVLLAGVLNLSLF